MTVQSSLSDQFSDPSKSVDSNLDPHGVGLKLLITMKLHRGEKSNAHRRNSVRLKKS
nr:hypothetical protein Iba_scaffold40257CG0330 [Ipomoea batatas]